MGHTSRKLTEVDVIIPAGGKINPAFAKVVGTDNKALIRLEGISVLANTVSVIRSMPNVRQVVVIGDEQVRAEVGRAASEVLPVQESGPKNILHGMRWLSNYQNPAEKVLIVTSDLPFLTSGVLADFLARCTGSGDIYVPLISEESYAEAFPGTHATMVKTREGTFTTGCAYVMTPKSLFASMSHIERVFENRKSKLGMARLLGMKFVFGYLTKSLTVKAVEAKAKQLLNCEASAVRESPPELAFDIDYIEDYHYALQTMKLKAGQAAHV